MNWMKFKKYYFGLSAILVAASMYGLFTWGLKLGLDFKGGSVVEVSFAQEISSEEVTNKLGEAGIEISAVQKTSDGNYLIRMASLNDVERKNLDEGLAEYGEHELVRFENVGPSIGPELIKKTIYALILASVFILLWVALQFKDIKYGVSAVLAMLHDSFILVGAFSFLGKFAGAETDFLFVTALLTTLSFSVHDTIVVFDRVRETKNKEGGNMVDLANRALSETMVRSLNNSFTIMFMLVALILLGGSTIKWFAAALLVGTVLGTYSSPFVAVPLLVTFYGFKKIK